MKKFLMRNIAITHGDSKTVTIKIRDVNGILDRIDYECHLQVRNEAGELMFEGKIYRYQEDMINWHIRIEDSLLLTPGEYYQWDLHYDFFKDEVLIDRKTVIRGKLSVRREETIDA